MKPENLSPDLELTYRNYFSEECVDNGGLRGRHEGGSPRLSSPLLSSSSLSTFSPTDSGQPSPDHRAQYVQLKNERMDYRYIGVLWALTSSHANCQTTNSWNPSHGRLYFSDWRGKWDVCLGVDRQMRPAGQVSHQAVLRADQGSVTTWEFYKQRGGGGEALQDSPHYTFPSGSHQPFCALPVSSSPLRQFIFIHQLGNTRSSHGCLVYCLTSRESFICYNFLCGKKCDK